MNRMLGIFGIMTQVKIRYFNPNLFTSHSGVCSVSPARGLIFNLFPYPRGSASLHALAMIFRPQGALLCGSNRNHFKTGAHGACAITEWRQPSTLPLSKTCNDNDPRVSPLHPSNLLTFHPSILPSFSPYPRQLFSHSISPKTIFANGLTWCEASRNRVSKEEAGSSASIEPSFHPLKPHLTTCATF